MGGFEEMCTLYTVIMLCSIFVTMLPDMFDDSFIGTRGLHRNPSQLCLIKRIGNFKVSNLNLGYFYSIFF